MWNLIRRLLWYSGKENTGSVRSVLLRGIFFRILIIEGILLVWSLLYRFITNPQTTSEELFWYAFRIVIMVIIIIIFVMVTFRSFLTKRVILPLEIIADANRRLKEENPDEKEILLPEETPREIVEIVSTRKQMLDNILRESKDRLLLVKFIRETFGRYLSQKIVDEILESPNGRKVGGRSETVTILMSDLRGFTGLSESENPEVVVQLLNRYLEKMSQIILKYEGMIDEFIGDSILAVFGVPEPRKEDPMRAVACAIAMQNALTVLNSEIIRDGHPPLEMGIGINTGRVIVGNIGSEMRLKYGIVGSTVNVASRIESNAIGGQVLIGESTYQNVKGSVIAQPAKTVMMKGIKKPVAYFPVIGIGTPYHLSLATRTEKNHNVEISLPFSWWYMEEKLIIGEPLHGETVMIGDKSMTVLLEGKVNPLDNIKLIFDFCIEAHCFDAVYAKVISVEEGNNGVLYHLRTTSISQKDEEMLMRWVNEIA
ncbi:MAG: adenylate/guanylate cyclase domain-containing protein [Thermodesulfobacteriota bacterium]